MHPPIDLAVLRTITSKHDKRLAEDAWSLISINDTRQGVWILFMMREGSTKRAQHKFIRVTDGKAEIFIAGRPQGMKRARRERVTALAHQAIAYGTLMGTVEGFPLQEEI